MNFRIGIPIYFIVLLLLSLWTIDWREFMQKDLGLEQKQYGDIDIKVPDAAYENGEVKLQSFNANYKVFYTTNGADPREQGAVWNGALEEQEFMNLSNIQGIPTSVKWKAPIQSRDNIQLLRYYLQNELQKTSKTYSYSFNLPQVNLPIISITVDEKDLFDPDEGIYTVGNASFTQKMNPGDPWWEWPANYKNRGIQHEKKAFVEFFDTSQNRFHAQFVGIRINGNATRAYPQKSLRIKVRSMYEDQRLFWPLFQKEGIQKFDGLILRNGGNDWDFTMLRDAFIHRLALNIDVRSQDASPTIVYINGVYWGIHNLRPRVKDNLIADWEQTKKSKINIIENDGILDDGSDKEHRKLMESIEQMLSANNQDSVYQKFNDVLNAKAFYRYFFLETYFANTDWPKNNVLLYNVDGYSWQPVIKDMDYGAGYTGAQAAQTNMFDRLKKSNVLIAKIFQLIQDNPSLEKEWKDEVNALLKNQFKEANMLSHLRDLSAQVESEIPYHARRWRKIKSVDVWQNNLNEIEEFILQRRNVYLKHLEEL